MYGTLDISVSGMIAQRQRIDTIAANLANRETILDENLQPNPYRRRIAIFAPGNPAASNPSSREFGVHLAEIAMDQGAFRKVYDPTSPYARPPGEQDAGYVYYPNVDPVTEQVSAIETVRAYEANVAAAEATKAMMAQSLRLIA